MLKTFKQLWVKLFHPKIANKKRPKYSDLNDPVYGCVNLGRYRTKRPKGSERKMCRLCGRRELKYPPLYDIH